MDVICLAESAFYALIPEYVKTKETVNNYKWVDAVEAMKRLNIKSKTTLQELRDQGKIRFGQHHRKNISYDMDSVSKYLKNP